METPKHTESPSDSGVRTVQSGPQLCVLSSWNTLSQFTQIREALAQGRFDPAKQNDSSKRTINCRCVKTLCTFRCIFFFYYYDFFLNIDFGMCRRVIHYSWSVQNEGMLHSSVLQWPCNAILHSGPSGQTRWASISCQRDQHSIFSPSWPVVGGGWKKTKQTMGAERWWLHSYCWRSPAHTRLFHALFCPSRVDLTGWHRPQTSWIMHYRKHSAQHRLCLVAHCLCWHGPKVFVQSC